jgi:hypothetical protein
VYVYKYHHCSILLNNAISTDDLSCLWLTSFQDTLMEHPVQPWFSSLVSIEVIFQLPFFFLAIYAILQQSKQPQKRTIHGDGTFKSLCIIYGSSTATTLVPILQCILTDEETNMSEKGILLGFYLPYLIFPIWLVTIAVCNDDIFGGVDVSKKGQ